MSEYLLSNVMGVEVYVDRYIAKDGQLYFCSCFKGAESVKGAQAGFLSRSDWEIRGMQYSRLTNNYKQLTYKISPALTHGLVYALDFFDGNSVKAVNIVFGDTGEKIKGQIFSRLKKYSSIPLLEEWRDIVIEETVSMLPMESFGVNLAYEVELPEDEILKDYVMANLSRLEILTEK